jgi:class 3 adenylate cyclase
MAELPSGTVTFLFTDLEGSTRLWEEHPEAMRAALAEHDALIRRPWWATAVTW